ncbi:MAG: tRNA (adenosine(37)-N6)-threonylcarbamoyltransferase complex ATPase subunit type 1 TsaE [Patescibacteria group bacterium]
MNIIITKNSEETRSIASEMAKNILSVQSQDKLAVVIALEGVLGAGKTTFTQGFAEGLGLKDDVRSPTFVILKEYHMELSDKNLRFKNFYHIDCYRLKDEKDIKDIGLSEILKNPENIILIEWAGNIKKALPKNCIKIKFYYISENKRKISIQ